jgi:hypothetical protein
MSLPEESQFLIQWRHQKQIYGLIKLKVWHQELCEAQARTKQVPLCEKYDLKKFRQKWSAKSGGAYPQLVISTEDNSYEQFRAT